MSNWPSITIVTPSYNQGRFISETICSVRTQNYPALQYFVVDGGSTDESVNVIHQNESFIDWWVSEKDRGQSHAINKGFLRASGDYVMWLNSDDLLLPTALWNIAKHINNFPQTDLLVGGLLIGSEDGVITSVHLPSHNYPWCMRAGAFDLFQPSMCIRRSTLLEIGLLREDLHCRMDAEMILRLARHTICCGHTRSLLAFLRRHPACKGETWGNVYEVERRALDDEYPVSQWHVVAARLYRRVLKTVDGTYLSQIKARKGIVGRNVSELYARSEKDR